MRGFFCFKLAVLALVLSGCKDAKQVEAMAPVKVASIELGQAISSTHREFNGFVEPAELTWLSFRIAGEIKDILVKPGQRVQKGQRLAQLDVRQLSQALTDAKARFELAERQYQRAEGLVKQQLLSSSEFDELRATLALARVNYQYAQTQLSYAQLVAPFDGIVAEVNKQNFETVNPGESVLNIYQHESIYVHLELPNSVMAQFDATQQGGDYQPLGYFAGRDTAFRLNYLKHSNAPSMQSGTFELWLSHAQLSPAILPGHEVRVVVDDLARAGLRAEQGFQVPMSVLVAGASPEQFMLWRIRDGRAEKVKVTVGEINSQGAMISHGVQVGDRIISTNLNALREGQQVEVMEQEKNR